jgi:DNA-directed RNA polymerase specialized sigma24 family protein
VTKRKSLPYDPSRSDSGVLANDLSYTDNYFNLDPNDEDSAALVLESLIQELPDRQRAAVEMCILARISYAEAGRMMKCSDQTMRRETMRAIAKIKKRIEATQWLVAILDRSFLQVETSKGEELPEINNG